jgi:hypothetical protein
MNSVEYQSLRMKWAKEIVTDAVARRLREVQKHPNKYHPDLAYNLRDAATKALYLRGYDENDELRKLREEIIQNTIQAANR